MTTELPTNLKNIIFDLGNVLFTWTPEKAFNRICSPILNKTFDKIPQEILLIWHEFDRGKISESKLRIDLSTTMGVPLETVDALLESLKRSLTPIPETVDLLHHLHNAGYPLYCLSNISSSFGHYLKNRNNFLNLFQGIIFSADVKCVKPEPDIYHILCNRFNIMPNESVFIDDRIENLETARMLGFRVIRFSSPAQTELELNSIIGNPCEVSH